MPTGGVLPDGADAVVMVEHTQATMPGHRRVTRPVAPGDGTVAADEDVAAGAALVPLVVRCARLTWACWRPPEWWSSAVHRRPAGRPSCPPATRWCRRHATLVPGQVRDA